MNERITENIVRKYFTEYGYYDDSNFIIDEQKSRIPQIDKLLHTASKKGSGKGYPEFIISSKNKPDDLIVIDCKRDTFHHESKDRKQSKIMLSM